MRKENDAWVACGPDEITGLAGRLRTQRERRLAIRAALGAACAIAAAAAVALIWFYPHTDDGPDFAGISCHRVAELAEAYEKKGASS